MFSEDRLPYSDSDTEIDDLDSCVGRVRPDSHEETTSDLPLGWLEIGVRAFNILVRYRTGNLEVTRVRTVGDVAALSDLDLYRACRNAPGENVSWQRFYKDLGLLGEARDLARQEIQNAIYRDERAAGIEQGE